MSVELNVVFPDKDHVSVRFKGEESGVLPFANPLTAKDRKDIQWYLEVYGSSGREQRGWTNLVPRSEAFLRMNETQTCCVKASMPMTR